MVRDRLCAGLEAAGQPHDKETVDRFARLLELLEKWSRAYNLTAIRDLREMVALHILDSLSIRGELVGERVLDIGTGAGFPGLPLALLEPARRFTLLDSNAKKVRFVRQAVLELGLANVTPVKARIQDFAPADAFDTVVARAFASLDQFVALAAPFVGRDGRLLAMQGRAPNAPPPLPDSGWRSHILRLRVPTLDQERHVIIIERGAA